MISWAVIVMSIAFRNASMSKRPFFSENFIRFRDARLHAESSRNMYSEHGLDALMVAVIQQHPRLLLFVRLAVDEFNDVRMTGVQDDHLCRAPCLATGLDHARKGVKTLHEGNRARRDTTAGKLFLGRTDGREIAAGSGAPFEKHPFGPGELQNRAHRVFNGIDETSRALRVRLNPAVEPYR